MAQDFNLYDPHPSQQEVRQSKARYRVLVCGRRWGKTTLAVNEAVFHAIEHGGDIWYVAPTYRQAKEIAWRMLKQIYHALPKWWKRATNESELWVEFRNGARVSLKGADNEDSLRGSALNGLIMDEVDSYRGWEQIWHEVLAPSLVDRKGWAWFIGTPKGHHTLYQLRQLAEKDKDYEFFHFTSYDNPYLSKEVIDEEKARMTENAFAQEFLADFRKYSGLIYKLFDREQHLIDDVPLPGGDLYYRAIDFGALNPTACLWIRVARNTDEIFVYDEYYMSEQTTDYHAGQILARHPQTNFTATFGDPSGRQQIMDYAKFNLHITPANRQVVDHLTGTLKAPKDQLWVKDGIEKVQELLKHNAVLGGPRLKIARKCENLIREFEAYRWEEARPDLDPREVVRKVDDHLLDCLRYFIVSYVPKRIATRAPEPLQTSRITGY